VNRRASLTLAIGLATAGLALTACSADPSAATTGSGGTPKLKVTGAFMPQPIGDLAAGFLVISNSGKAPDKLTSVSSTLSDNISIHKTVNQRMEEVTSFTIPAGGKLDLERGGSHVMFADIKHPVKKGQSFTVELHFQKTPPITITVPVKETNFQPDQQ
jgi:copper(I)-binding protein